MPLTLPKLYLRTENAVPRRPSAERGRMLEGSGFGMVLRAADALQSRKASLIAAFADTCGGAQKGARGSAGALGESRACGLALCGFCRGGVHLIFVEEGLSIFCRRVRTARKGCRAGCGGDGFWRRSAEAGAGRYCCCCCCCCCARRTRAALDLGNAAAGGGDGQRLLVIRRSERRFLQRLCLFYYAS